MTGKQTTIRSLLSVPGHRADWIEKAMASEADALMLDLEDAVPEEQKNHARDVVCNFLACDSLRDGPSGKAITVRINGQGTSHMEADRDQLAAYDVDVVIPKVINAQDITVGIPAHRGKGMATALIEYPGAFENLYQIARHPRCDSLLFGVADFLAATAGTYGDNQEGILCPRHQIVIAARAVGVTALDCPCVDVHDEDKLRAHIGRARMLGYDGMLCLSLKQVAVCNREYTPSSKEIETAREVVDGAAQAQERGDSIATHKGSFVSPPTLKRAQKLLEKAERLGVV